ncbi:DNA topoisomerase III (EC [uncultured Gammaproteobacteria bacterium]|jgi:DNA topoisomerase-3|nr:DNA topoisomerase III (EC 5.99.1.2) [uncultured Gammaproteobacteria bacterium]VVH66187.1 DNA topoisomerase III (EC [uncultured Gammaproteobacteria bacterium]
MKLYMCEKPNQAGDLARNLNITGSNDGFIGNDNKAVTWAIEHLIGQYNPDDYDKKYKNWDVDDFLIVPSIWKMKETESKKRQLKITGNLLKKANEVIISTDGDREGEVIGRELLDYLRWVT